MNDTKKKKNEMSYEEFIRLSRYARWIDDKNRRETWNETVDRYSEFMRKLLPNNINKSDKKDFENAINMIKNKDIMPSMRALWTAGKALEQSNIGAYNCAYTVVNRMKSFPTVMYILMHGTGVGYSVERKYVDEMPSISGSMEESDEIIVFKDSRLGWAEGYYKYIQCLVDGQIPKYDTSKIRPAGSKLKTFGGRASGSEPLIDLLEYTKEKFINASGRKLKPIECHDLMCKIAEVVISGGTRRSALISLSDLHDNEIKLSKHGEFWHYHPERSCANNSAVYEEKPDLFTFMDEFKNIIKSNSGERGIVNREALKKTKPERRDESTFGLNPCVTGDTKLLTKEYGFINIGDVIDKSVNIWNGYEWSVVKPFSTGINNLYKIIFDNGEEIKCTDYHKFILSDNKRVEAKNLKKGMKLKKFNMPDINIKNYYNKDIYIKNIINLNESEETFCVTEPKNNSVTFNGIVTANCGEISLPPNSFCNLTEIIARKDDDYDILSAKAKSATILGILQSLLTNFKFIGKKWQNNCEKERLLGVSITGIMDNKYLSKYCDETKIILKQLKENVLKVSEHWSKILDVNMPAGTTTVKPSGNVSQLCNTSSGIHARYSKYYIRRVRLSKHDPITKFLIKKGLNWNPENGQSVENCTTMVFDFPIASPKNAIIEKEITAIDQLNHWKMFKECWAEHNVSVTIKVSENEWFEVMNWVYNNWDYVAGLSFLPKDNHAYELAPYEEITKEEYEKMSNEFPEIDFNEFNISEKEDNTTGSREFACVGGKCEI